MSNRTKTSVWTSWSVSGGRSIYPAALSLVVIFLLEPSFHAAGLFPATRLLAQASFGTLTGSSAGASGDTVPDDTKPDEKPHKKRRTSKKKATSGDERGDSSGNSDSAIGGSLLSSPKKVRYRFGMEFEAKPGGECSNLFGSAPIPMEWPEQKVTLIEEMFPREARVGYRELKEGGCKQLLFKMRTLYEGQKTEASVVIEVTRYAQAPPADTKNLAPPKKPDRLLRHYLEESPYIEVGDRQVRKIADTIKNQTKDLSSWEQVDAVLGFVRENVHYNDSLKEATIRGAVAAIETQEGDCEDMSALFIAILRNLDIPARTVRVPDHCWAEFYLEDSQGNGHWFPAQVAGNEQLGVSSDTRPILQKGDSFHLPESPREETRYVKELFTGDVRQNGPDPRVQFIREEVAR